MRPATEYLRTIALVAEGLNDAEVSRRTGIPRRTISDWRRGTVRAGPRRRQLSPSAGRACPGDCGAELPVVTTAPAQYAYLLGQYLGDGTISHHPRGVRRLRISCTAAYPGIVAEVRDAIRAVLPDHAVGTSDRPGVTEVSAYWKHWPCLFPQHGPGMKHTRPILLEPWQDEIRGRHPTWFLRGLVHSDGCRHVNPVVRPLRDGPKTYYYTRYVFTNESTDIRRLFTDTCDHLGIHWTQANRKNVAVSRREDVARLDEFIGPKS